ncbi:MAG: tetratricopeptide repeat protein [Planctomycetaceae bacterium]|jgi:tetratricopeptide (TPR) repeat protein|nr:tetratricopeptide repeat protein [Planctomycetaceae bacterium]
MLSFWPGYRGIVQYGHWTFLVIALLFALFLDVLLVANFYWTAMITTGQRNLLLIIFFAVWFGLFTVAALRSQFLNAMLKTDNKETTFREAILFYLRGDWFGTESLLLQVLKKNPRDVEVLLLLATLYRHTQRYEEALEMLNKLSLFENAGHWFLETETERKLIAEESAPKSPET